jgi:hypothetical protein
VIIWGLQHMRSVGQLVLDGLAVDPHARSNAAAVTGPGAAGFTEAADTSQLSAAQLSAPKVACEASFVFHRPPYNSIDHLHLHCIGVHPRRRKAIDYIKVQCMTKCALISLEYEMFSDVQRAFVHLGRMEIGASVYAPQNRFLSPHDLICIPY